VIEIMVTDIPGWDEVVVPEGLKLADIHPSIMDGSVWPEVRKPWGSYFVNPAHIISIRERG
jgi:hypothetical protein